MKTYLIIILFFFTNCIFAQLPGGWTLQQCIEYGLANSISIYQAKLNTESNKATYMQTRLNNLPNLNGFATHSYNFGQTIDRYTNQFANQRVQSNNFGLSSNMTVFSGLQNYNNWKQSKANYQASLQDEEKSKNDLVLNIVNAFLQILFAKENVNIARNQVNQTQKQLERTQRLFEAGTVNKANLLSIESQLASEELQLVNAENNLDLAKLNLALILNIENPQNFDVVNPHLEIPSPEALAINAEGLYSIAEQKLPEIKSAELKLRGSEFALASAKGGSLPSITLNASIATGYSGLRKDFSDPVLMGYQTFLAPDQTTLLLQPVYSYKTTTIQPFSKQFNNNLNKTIGLNLTMPIFNGWQTQTAIKRARLNVLNQKLNYDNTKIQLRRNIQQATADAIAAQKKYMATLKAKDAQAENLKYIEQRFNLGAVNPTEYNDAKNRYAKAELDLLQAKYDFVFKVKILEFYQGKTLIIE